MHRPRAAAAAALAAFLSACWWCAPARADTPPVQPELGGYAGAQFRAFPKPPLHERQSRTEAVLSVVVSPEWKVSLNDGRSHIIFNPHAVREVTGYDPERNRGDIRELKWTHRSDGWWVVAGIATVHWGKLESRQIVDNINQRDLGDTVDPDDKLGQPMVNVGWQSPLGVFDMYVLPYFREGTFPGARGRLRGAFPVDTGAPVYESGRQRRHTDIALRYRKTAGVFDVAASYFHGTGREPRVTLGSDRLGRPVLIPHYDIIQQVAVEGQATIGALLLKLEALRRKQNEEYYSVNGAGFEYTLFGIGGTGRDLGLLGEYLYDSRGPLAPPTNFDKELFLGFRLTSNDLDDTSWLGGVLLDARTGSQSYTLEYETRVGNHWSVKVQGQAFTHVDSSERVLYAARRDHNVLVRLSYHF